MPISFSTFPPFYVSVLFYKFLSPSLCFCCIIFFIFVYLSVSSSANLCFLFSFICQSSVHSFYHSIFSIPIYMSVCLSLSFSFHSFKLYISVYVSVCLPLSLFNFLCISALFSISLFICLALVMFVCCPFLFLNV